MMTIGVRITLQIVNRIMMMSVVIVVLMFMIVIPVHILKELYIMMSSGMILRGRHRLRSLSTVLGRSRYLASLPSGSSSEAAHIHRFPHHFHGICDFPLYYACRMSMGFP